MLRGLLLAASLALAAGPAQACRLALALALDVSASVDMREYRMQLEGVAAALQSPPVRDALLHGPGGPVAIAVYEWSGWQDQRLLVDWVLVTDAAVLGGVAARLVSTERAEMSDSTALGQALLEGGALLARAPRCWRHVLDVSGDGKNNDGADPDMLEDEPLLAGVTVNGLVIGADNTASTDLRAVNIGELSSYFHANVIRGPGAFVQVALGFEDYERAMTRKLVRELAPVAMSGLPASALPPALPPAMRAAAGPVLPPAAPIAAPPAAMPAVSPVAPLPVTPTAFPVSHLRADP